MTELEAILLFLITVGNIILLIVLCLGYMIKKKHEKVVFEYEKLITSYKKTLEIMDANITHLRKVARENTEQTESIESGEININSTNNINNSEKDK